MGTHFKARAGLIGFLLLILIPLGAAELYGFPQSINESRGDASIHITIDRSWRLLADRCVTLEWDIQQINAVFLNGDGETGTGQESLCGENQAVLRLDFRDGSSREYLLSSVPFFATVWGWLVLVLISLLSYGIFYSFGLAISPQAFVRELGEALRGLRRELRHYFNSESKSHIALLFAILIAGLVLRLLFLDGPIRYDEANSLNNYALADNIFEALSRYDRPNNHLLNTLLMHIAVKSFASIDERVFRLPHLLAGLFTILLTYIAARQRVDKNSALLAAALVAVSSAMISYSVIARGYMLQIACFMILLILSEILAKQRSRVAWFFFAIFAALGFFAVVTMLYGFVGLALYLLVMMPREDRRRFWEWCVGIFWAGWLSLLLYVPVLSRFGIGAIVNNDYTAKLSWEAFLGQIPSVSSYFLKVWFGGMPEFVFLALLLLVVSGAIWQIRETHKPRRHWLLPIVLLSTIGIVLIQAPALYASGRIFLFLFPILMIAIAKSLIFLFEKFKAVRLGSIGLIGGLALLLGLSRAPYHSLESGVYHDAEAVTAYLAEVENQNYRLAFSPNYDEPLNYYFRRYGISQEQMSRDYESVESIYFVVRDDYDASVNAVRSELIGRAASQFTEPYLVASFEYSDMYRVDRR